MDEVQKLEDADIKLKLRLGVLFGVRSPEPGSVHSAVSVCLNLDREKYDIIPIGIDRKGDWQFFHPEKFLSKIQDRVIPTFEPNDFNFPVVEKKVRFSPLFLKKIMDIAFPVFHGPFGEDGTIQGMLRLADLPFAGSDVLASALCMDKKMTKKVLAASNLPFAPYLTYHEGQSIDFNEVVSILGLPLFVKPTSLGSSVGVSKVSNEKEWDAALKEAFKYQSCVLVEQAIYGREILCSVIGNLNPVAAPPIEVLCNGEFLTPKLKETALGECPAKIDPDQTKQIQELAIRAYKVFHCEGYARIDFFLQKNGNILINEINSIPDFVSGHNGDFVNCWASMGISFSKLLDLIIGYAFERYKIETEKANSRN